MNQGPRWTLLMKKTRVVKSRATVPLQGQFHEIFFTSNFFYETQPDSTVKNMQKIAEMKLSSYGLEVADIGKNWDCGIAVAEQHFFKKLRNCDCGSASFQLPNCDCEFKRSYACTSGNYGGGYLYFENLRNRPLRTVEVQLRNKYPSPPPPK